MKWAELLQIRTINQQNQDELQGVTLLYFNWLKRTHRRRMSPSMKS